MIMSKCRSCAKTHLSCVTGDVVQMLDVLELTSRKIYLGQIHKYSVDNGWWWISQPGIRSHEVRGDKICCPTCKHAAYTYGANNLH